MLRSHSIPGPKWWLVCACAASGWTVAVKTGGMGWYSTWCNEVGADNGPLHAGSFVIKYLEIR